MPTRYKPCPSCGGSGHQPVMPLFWVWRRPGEQPPVEPCSDCGVSGCARHGSGPECAGCYREQTPRPCEGPSEPPKAVAP
jgi:hypothetical protein